MSVLLDLARTYLQTRQELDDVIGSAHAVERLPDADERRALEHDLRVATNQAHIAVKHAQSNLADHVVILCRRLGYLDEDSP